jgi:hypothetical protein
MREPSTYMQEEGELKKLADLNTRSLRQKYSQGLVVIDRNLYSMMLDQSIYKTLLAYDKLKSKPGKLTPGIIYFKIYFKVAGVHTKTTLDGISKE